MIRLYGLLIGLLLLSPLVSKATRAVAIDHPGGAEPGSDWSTTTSWVSSITPWSGVDTVFIGPSSWIDVNADISYDGIVIVEGQLNINGSGTDIVMDYASMIKIQDTGMLWLDLVAATRLTQTIVVGSRTYTSADSDDGGAWYFDHELTGPSFITASGTGSSWISTSTWTDNFSINRVPAAGDSIIVPAGVDVHVPASTTIDLTGSSTVILVYGSLELDGGSDSEIEMDGGSDNYVYVHTYNSSTGDGALEVIGPIIQGGSYFSASDDTEPGSDGLGDANTLGGFGKIVDGDWATMSGPLPVKLQYFYAKARGEQIALTWQTSEEINFSYFEVQRSDDGRTFWTIGTVEGKGDAKSLTNYQFFDNSTVFNQVYYRLRSVDFDGSFEYSKIISVHLESVNNQVIIYPNPVSSNSITLAVHREYSGNPTFALMNFAGKVILSGEVTNPTRNIKLPADISAGLYYLKVSIDGYESMHKMVKK